MRTFWRYEILFIPCVCQTWIYYPSRLTIPSPSKTSLTLKLCFGWDSLEENIRRVLTHSMSTSPIESMQKRSSPWHVGHRLELMSPRMWIVYLESCHSLWSVTIIVQFLFNDIWQSELQWLRWLRWFRCLSLNLQQKPRGCWCFAHLMWLLLPQGHFLSSQIHLFNYIPFCGSVSINKWEYVQAALVEVSVIRVYLVETKYFASLSLPATKHSLILYWPLHF